MQNVPIHIRLAEIEDAKTIIDLAHRTFAETYGDTGNKEDLNVFLAANFNQEILLEELGSPNAIFFIAFIHDQPVGFVKLRNDKTAKSLEGKKTLEIERIYVLKEFQGFSVGKELMEKIKDIARKENYAVIWLQVWQENMKAVRFYQKAGFVAYETTVFRFGNSIHHDFIMKFDLY